jgi:tRNA(Ile)-lysidine synthase
MGSGRVTVDGKTAIRRTYDQLVIESAARQSRNQSRVAPRSSRRGETAEAADSWRVARHERGKNADGEGETAEIKSLRDLRALRGARSSQENKFLTDSGTLRAALQSHWIALRVPGTTVCGGLGVRVSVRVAPGVVKERGRVGVLPAAATLSAAAVGRRRLYVRRWRAGDRMNPLGMQGSKKLQDVFVDGKVPAELRRRVPVFECAGALVWVPGYRVARGWEVKDAAERSLQIRVEAVGN